MTIKEIAGLCGVDRRTIERWAHKVADNPGQNAQGSPAKKLILQGADPGIVAGDKAKLALINKSAEGSGVFDLLKNYDKAKAERKAIDGKADKCFKNYRDSRLKLLQNQVKTDKAIIKAKNELEAAIDAIAPIEEKRQIALKALREIMPMTEYGPGGKELAEAAII